MVANANIKAAFAARFINSSGPRMQLLASRLLSDIAAGGGLWRPDIVLLQEAISRPQSQPSTLDDLSASRLATELSFATGDRYEIVVDPGYRRVRGVGVATDTAIIANTATMDPPLTAGFFSSETSHRKLQLNGPGPDRPARAPIRRHAWALLRESDPDGLIWPASSVHLLTDRRLGCPVKESCQGRINRKKAQWARQIAFGLDLAGGEAAVRAIVAGDFNATRKEAFHGAILGLGFLQAARARVDFVFSRAPFGAFGADPSRRVLGGDYDFGYSDHRFLWAQLG